MAEKTVTLGKDFIRMLCTKKCHQLTTMFLFTFSQYWNPITWITLTYRTIYYIEKKAKDFLESSYSEIVFGAFSPLCKAKLVLPTSLLCHFLPGFFSHFRLRPPRDSLSKSFLSRVHAVHPSVETHLCLNFEVHEKTLCGYILNPFCYTVGGS